MANCTAWTAGNGAGYTWTSLFATADLEGLVNGDSVLSSLSAIANQSNQDLYGELAIEAVIASGKPSAGANFMVWLAELGEDGSTYGDGQLTAGTPAAYTPPWPPCAVFAIQSVNTVTSLIGPPQLILLPFNSFRCILQNNTGITLSSSTASVAKLITGNLNLNN
jgi:hypothetical protein